MAANEGWYSAWFAGGWFPSVWFAPGDESHLAPEEIRPEYRGGSGRTLPARDPFFDATDADIERLVREKWEAIERASLPEIPDSSTGKESLQVADHFAGKTTEDVTETDFGNITPASWVGPHIGPPAKIAPVGAHVGPVLPPVLMAMDSAVIEQSRIEEDKKRQAEEDEALILLLAAV